MDPWGYMIQTSQEMGGFTGLEFMPQGIVDIPRDQQSIFYGPDAVPT